MAQSMVSLHRIEQGDKLAKIITWFEKEIELESFEKRYDRRWKKGGQLMKKYTSHDIQRLIAQVRSSHR